MLIRPLTQSLPLALRRRGRQSLEALAGLKAHEQLELACRNVVGVLAVARASFERTREDQEAYDVLCDAVVRRGRFRFCHFPFTDCKNGSGGRLPTVPRAWVFIPRRSEQARG